MASPACEHAIEDALKSGKALLKFISANDVNATGAHQYGFYLPKSAWQLFSPHPPIPGENKKSWPKVIWENGVTTNSCVTWYGVGTRSEYRLTRFQEDFAWFDSDSIGSLLVIVSLSHHEFHAYVLDTEEDIEEIQAALNVQVLRRFAVYDEDDTPLPEGENECIERHFREFIEGMREFPDTRTLSVTTQNVLETCLRSYRRKSADDRLMLLVREEYRLFRMIERQICGPGVQKMFADIDDFLGTASSIMNRRKSRAGRSLEHHVEYLLREANVSFTMRADVRGEPDILIPSKTAYDDPEYPDAKLVMLGVKTTCKDRWRQILEEAPRIPQKHLLTLQVGISAGQLTQMRSRDVTLIVPRPLHKEYDVPEGVTLLDVESFIQKAKASYD